MSFQLPPIVKVAERLLLEIEQAVRTFPRYHKYQVGAELRRQAMALATLTHRAWRDQQHRADWIAELVWAVDGIKIALQLASQVRAFNSFGQFEQVYRTAGNLGKQAGGWRSKHPKGQSAAAGGAAAARPDTEYPRRLREGAYR